jgi:hypothetical protein
VNLQCAFFAIAFGINVAMEMFSGRLTIDDFHAADFEYAIAECRIKTGGFGV